MTFYFAPTELSDRYLSSRGYALRFAQRLPLATLFRAFGASARITSNDSSCICQLNLA